MPISDSELEALVRRVVGELHAGPAGAVGRRRPRPRPAAIRSPATRPPRPVRDGRRGGRGRAAAQRELAKGGVALRQAAIAAIRKVGHDQAETLARAAHEETGLGRVRDKVAKMHLAAERSVGTEDFDEPRAFAGQYGLTIEDWLPWGVVASVTPTNSPSAFMINHGITMLAGGNAVAFNAHPMCKWTSMRTVELMNEAVVAAGGPDNLMTGVVAPTLDTARELVTHAGVDMLCITGGAELVRDAFGTGKRVIAAGPGHADLGRRRHRRRALGRRGDLQGRRLRQHDPVHRREGGGRRRPRVRRPARRRSATCRRRS